MPRTHVAIIGAPLDLGQDRRGVDMGPSAVRVANLHARVASLGYQVLWTRLLASGSGNRTYVFTLILATFLVGLALRAAYVAARSPVSPAGGGSRIA